MGRPSATAVGLCLLWLLGNWQTGQAENKITRTIELNAYEYEQQDVNCSTNERIRIRNARWGGFNIWCPYEKDRTSKMRGRCDGHQSCKYIPHHDKEDHLNINLGDVCHGAAETLKGVAECWNPCATVDCGEGGQCKTLALDSYECVCNKAGDTGGCEPKRRKGTWLDAREKATQEIQCAPGEVIHIKSAIWSGFNTHCPKKIDRTQKLRSRCEGHQNCTYIPHWSNDTAPHINFGDVCWPGAEYLKGEAECWNPCHDVDCGKGGECKALTRSSYKCVCNGAGDTGGCDPKRTKGIWLYARENATQHIHCTHGETIHIKSAIYSGFNAKCPKKVDRTDKLRSRCEGHVNCTYIPHWSNDSPPYINFGDVCWPGAEYLKGAAECWNSCLNVDCGEGECSTLTYNTYKCTCRKGFANADGKPGGVCERTEKGKEIELDAQQKKLQVIECDDDNEVIHIKTAIWSGFSKKCRKQVDRTEKIRGRCEGKHSCLYKPHWKKEDEIFINLGDVCFGIKETLRGKAECWNPCLKVKCGEHGKCKSLTLDSYKCECDEGYANADDKPDAVCVKSKKSRTIELNVLENETQTVECKEGELIHITSAKWGSSTQKCTVAADKTELVRYRCEGLQSCKLIPHWALDYFHYINLGDPCPDTLKRLKGEAECWNPCLHVKCEEGVCVPLTFDSHKCEKRDPRHTKSIRIENMESEKETLDCKEGELIHIKSVIWSGFIPHCDKKVDVTDKIRERCGNQRDCSFIPHWRDEESSLILQSRCPMTGEYIRGEAQCWNPCLGAECDEGQKCTPLTYNTHECA